MAPSTVLGCNGDHITSPNKRPNVDTQGTSHNNYGCPSVDALGKCIAIGPWHIGNALCQNFGQHRDTGEPNIVNTIGRHVTNGDLSICAISQHGVTFHTLLFCTSNEVFSSLSYAFSAFAFLSHLYQGRWLLAYDTN